MNNKPFAKGLGALIPKKIKKPEIDTPKASDAVYYIDVTKIAPNPYQPRKEFDLEALKSLSQSISDYGILQPLVVTRDEKTSALGSTTEYQLIAGERRLTAAKMAGLKEVPVIIRQTSTKEKLQLAIIENVQREDLNPIEKALGYKQLEDEFAMNQKDVAKLAGKSRESVANTLRLLNLPLNIQQALRDNKITEGHARAILGLKEVAEQDRVFQKVLTDGLTVRGVEELVQKHNVVAVADNSQKKSMRLYKEFLEMEKMARTRFGHEAIKMKNTSGKPSLMITFASIKEAEEFLNRFSA